VQLPTRWHKW